VEKHYKFSELSKEHQIEVIGNIGLAVAAEKTVWELVPDYPVDLAAGMAWDTSVMIFDDRVESTADKIRRAGKVLRPILIDDLDEDSPWMEGRHRSIASEKLGLKTIPALVRIR
jgi:hypothetical protein